jgi:large subunit ribosomal protein L24
VDSEKGRVLIEKVNFVKRHTKARGQGQPGGILEKEAPIAISNVLLYDAKAGKGVRVGTRKTKDGKRERISRSTGEAVGKAE